MEHASAVVTAANEVKFALKNLDASTLVFEYGLLTNSASLACRDKNTVRVVPSVI